MIIAVTGVTGFIGNNLCSFFEQKNYQIVKLNREILGNDELLNERLTNVDVIVHLAGKSSMDRSISSSFGREGVSMLSDYFESNIQLTEKLLKHAVRNKIKKIIYTSSRMVYPSYLKEIRNENMKERPDSSYGLSKIIAEELIKLYAENNNMTSVILRLSQVIGEGDNNRGILPTFIQNAKENKKITINGTGAAVRDFVDVRDVVRAIELAILKEMPSCIVNIANEKAYSVKEYAELVLKLSGKDLSGIQYNDVTYDDKSSFSLDITLAKKILGWQPEWNVEKIIKNRLG
jgi:UDP-glucose 4-epimerase